MVKRNLEVFRQLIWQFYARNRRDLPWRRTRDPYKIFVSEIMLQQTQVSRVLPKYREFISHFPTFDALERAPLEAVLRVWQGLGYNRRVLALKRTAEIVVRKFKGRLPRLIEELDALPGIGKATAGSIVVFTLNIPVVFIETNIRRVFIYHFFNNRENVTDADILPLVAATLDRRTPREWYAALMDYGSHLGRAVENPNRRSRHYVRQSKFEGSQRQIRGAILSAATGGQKISFTKLARALSKTKLELSVVTHELAQEGFLKRRGAYIMLA